MKRYRNLVSYYTNKNISVSYLRAKKKNDLDRIMGLYGNMNERYWLSLIHILINLLMRWSSGYNLHIHTVLHLNKGDDNTRGHIRCV